MPFQAAYGCLPICPMPQRQPENNNAVIPAQAGILFDIQK